VYELALCVLEDNNVYVMSLSCVRCTRVVYNAAGLTRAVIAADRGFRCRFLDGFRCFTRALLFITARRYASEVYAVVVYLSVTSRHCTKTAKRRITQTTPYDSPGTHGFLMPKILAKLERSHRLWGAK